MKRMKKLFLLGLLCCVCLFVIKKEKVYAEKYSCELAYNVDNQMVEYITEHYEELISVEISLNEIQNVEPEDCSLGDAFIVYNSEICDESKTYYFPVYCNGDVISVVYVIDTTEGYSIGDDLDSDIIYILNSIGRQQRMAIEFVGYELHIYTQSTSYIYKDDVLTQTLEDNEALVKVNNYIENMHPYDVKNAIEFSNTDEYLDTYTPGYAINTSSEIWLNLCNPAKQGTLPICWSAAIATIINYRKGTDYTAVDILNDTGHTETADHYYNMPNFLEFFGVKNYQVYESDLGWSRIKKDISSKFPFYMGCSDGNRGHAVVGYGYTINSSGDKYLSIYNSGANGGAGAMANVRYTRGATNFSYSGTTFTWTKTVFRKYGSLS